ncbi:MAG TPA: hypothetical protein VF169_06945 [Albitalea sp.]|uniref:hypothetical protein n=1 Tax=Piscinibacter sp. TaxID=1903157 RepID=UPI002ED09228
MRAPQAEPRRSHLMSCPGCGAANGITALACWNCELQLLPELVPARKPAPVDPPHATEPVHTAADDPTLPVLDEEVTPPIAAIDDDATIIDPAPVKPSPWLESAPAGAFTAPPANKPRSLMLGAAGFGLALLVVGPFAYRLGDPGVTTPPPETVAAPAPTRIDRGAIQKAVAPMAAVSPLAPAALAQPPVSAMRDAASVHQPVVAAVRPSAPAPARAAPQVARSTERDAPRRVRSNPPQQMAQARLGRSGTAEAPPAAEAVQPPPPVAGPCTPQVAALGLCTPASR